MSRGSRKINVVKGKKGFQPVVPKGIMAPTSSKLIKTRQVNMLNMEYDNKVNVTGGIEDKFTAETMLVLWELSSNEDIKTKTEFITNIEDLSTPEEFNKFINNKKIYDWTQNLFEQKTARDLKELSAGVLRHFVSHPDNLVRERVAEHENTDSETLKMLYKDTSWSVRYSVVRNKHVPDEVLVKAAEDYDQTVRAAVAAGTHTPQKVLEVLANDSLSVREQVAKNEHTSQSILSKLALCKESKIRMEVAYNPHTSCKVLRMLCEDPVSSVATLAKHNLSIRYREDT